MPDQGCSVATRTQGPIPSRDSIRTSYAPPRVTRRQKVGIGTLIVAAILLAALVAVAAPRPNVSVQGTAYASSGCIASATSQVVTATFHLVNQGNADGYVTVRLDADGTGVGSGDFLVPAGTTMPGRVDATVNDCFAHRYSLFLFYVPPPA